MTGSADCCPAATSAPVLPGAWTMASAGEQGEAYLPATPGRSASYAQIGSKKDNPPTCARTAVRGRVEVAIGDLVASCGSIRLAGSRPCGWVLAWLGSYRAAPAT
jgi:hypothetical protein